MKPIAFFDLETTGVEVESSRIVQLAAIKVAHNLAPLPNEEAKCIMMNPGVAIPKEASEIHGITDEMVRDLPVFGKYAQALYNYLQGCDIGGFNSNRFDVPLLAEEFARVGITWPDPGTAFVDAYQIFAIKEARDLGNALRFYCGEDLEGAHDAKNDIIATVRVLRGQVQKYPDLQGLTAAQLMDFCQGDAPWVDLAGKIVLKDGKPVYGFGKDKGKTIIDNPGFALWMLKQSFPTNTKNVIKKILGYGK